MSSPQCAVTRYVMFDQSRDKVRGIMGERRQSELLARPSWLALTLLLVAFNIIAASSA